MTVVHPIPSVTVILPAAGRGARFGGATPKQYLPLRGRPLLVHTLAALHRHPAIVAIQPVIGPEDGPWWEGILPHLLELPRVLPPVTGGKERRESVERGLLALDLPEDAWVAVHDGARPFPSYGLWERLLSLAGDARAVIPTLPASDTVKEVDGEGRVVATLPRERIHLAQTPQLFRAGLLAAAHRLARQRDLPATDDAALVEALGETVRVVAGEADNIKITRPEDWSWAEALLDRLGGQEQ